MNNNNQVRLGFAEADITPLYPTECVGFSRSDNRSRGVLDKLLAQIVIWDSPTGLFCIVAIDNLGLTVEINHELRRVIAGKLQIPEEQIMVCFSHTHSAPNVAAEKAYFDFICGQILEGIDSAMDTLAPVKAAWGCAEADIGVNRRNNQGALDRRIGVLKINDAITDKLRLIMLRVSAHANVLTSDNYNISADYFGTTRKLLEQEYHCKIVITQGASGNIRPKYQHSKAVLMEEHPYEAAKLEMSPELVEKLFNESMEALNKMAAEINSAIGAIIKNLIPEPIYRIELHSETTTFLADVPSAERAREIIDEAATEAGIDGASWFEEVKQLHGNGIQQQKEKAEIQYFILNNGCWCGVANEAMCEIALDITQKLNNKLVFFGGYTNGCGGYLPTEEEYIKGGYEVLWSYLSYYMYHGHVMPLNSDTADKLSDLIAARLSNTLKE